MPYKDKKRILEYQKEYRKKNKEKIKKAKVLCYLKKPEKYKKVYRNYYLKNKIRLQKQQKKYYKQNKKLITKRNKQYVLRNKEKTKLYQKQYIIQNKSHLINYHRNYMNNRLHKDIYFRLSGILRHRVYMAIKGKYKKSKIINLIGCSIEELKQYLEKQFTLGMNWKNYGFGWHIDHIKPCASFDLSKPEEQQKCFHYSNLRPLWALENIKKKDKVYDIVATISN